MFASSFAAPWPPQYFSYALIASASLLGLLFPALAPIVLGPILLVGLVGLGLAHGACDQLVLPALTPSQHHPGRRMLLFVLGYLGLAAVAGLGWWYWPAGAVATFMLLTVWHWGSADAPSQPGQRAVWFLHSLLRGALLFAVPAWKWPAEVEHSANGLLVFAGSTPISAAQLGGLTIGLGLLVAGGHVLLWGYYSWQRQAGRAGADIGEVGLLTILFVVLPPLLAIGTYFVFWHSLQHALRLNRLFGYATPAGYLPAWRRLGREILFFLRRAFPLLVVSLAGLAGLYFLLPTQQRDGENAWLSLALVGAAVLTLPHALLVSFVLDAANWRQTIGLPQPAHATN